MTLSDDSSSDDDAPLNPEAEARRQRAIQLLAKVLKKPAADDDGNGEASGDQVKQRAAAAANADAEATFLRQLLDDIQKGVSGTKVAGSVRDRLSVLGVQRGSVHVAASAAPKSGSLPKTSDEAVDQEEAEAPATLPVLLERLKAGDMSAASSRIRSPAYWRSLVADVPAVAASPAATTLAAAATELPVPAESLAAMRISLDELGYGSVQASWTPLMAMDRDR